MARWSARCHELRAHCFFDQTASRRRRSLKQETPSGPKIELPAVSSLTYLICNLPYANGAQTSTFGRRHPCCGVVTDSCCDVLDRGRRCRYAAAPSQPWHRQEALSCFRRSRTTGSINIDRVVRASAILRALCRTAQFGRSPVTGDPRRRRRALRPETPKGRGWVDPPPLQGCRTRNLRIGSLNVSCRRQGGLAANCSRRALTDFRQLDWPQRAADADRFYSRDAAGMDRAL